WLLAIPAFTTAALALGVSAVSVPEAPARVDLDVMSGDEVAVTFSAPLSDGGSAVQSYEVEWDTDPGTREVQWVKTYADTGPNEVQSITTTADDVDETQQLVILANETQEVQV
ncbi:unnamed protein product, partial [Hapterophycus canaliculatus]